MQVLTVGQYLRPSERHLPVVRYWHPDEFAALERAAYELGFDHVAAGPLVRSSYHADQHVPQARAGVGPARRAALALARRRAAAAARPLAPAQARAMFPLKDNIPLERFPIVTVALIAINVIVYLLSIRHGGSFFGGPSDSVDGALRRDPLRAHAPGQPLRPASPCRALEGAASAVACQGSRGVTGTPPAQPADLGDRRSPRCSCTAASCTSSATCCSWRSSAPTSRTPSGALRFLAFYLLGGLAALAAQVARRPRLDRADARRLGRDRRRARRLHRCSIPARACSR